MPTNAPPPCNAPKADTTRRLALRPKEAAKALGISERKLWEITADRTSGIPHFRLGKVVLYPVGPLEKWMADEADAQEQRGGQ